MRNALLLVYASAKQLIITPTTITDDYSADRSRYIVISIPTAPCCGYSICKKYIVNVHVEYNIIISNHEFINHYFYYWFFAVIRSLYRNYLLNFDKYFTFLN